MERGGGPVEATEHLGEVRVVGARVDEAFKDRMGWTIPWYSTVDDFGTDFDVSDGFGFNVFYRSGANIYRTYFTTGRAAEALGTIWTLLDLTPLGRQETWEDSPEGTPQTPPYAWWRLHDEYEEACAGHQCRGPGVRCTPRQS